MTGREAPGPEATGREATGGSRPDRTSTGLRHHVAALTGMRAAACLMVLVSHAFFWTGNYTDDWFGRFGARLEVSVPFFFALSGYLLTRPWVRAGRTGVPAPRLRPYVRGRVRRIVPALWIVVVAVYLIYLVREAGPYGRGWDGFLRNMTFTQIYGYGHLHDSLTQLWSIGVEVSFYAVLPLLGWALVRLLRPSRGLSTPETTPGIKPDAPFPRVPGAPPRTGRALGFVAALIAVSPLWIWATHTDGFYALPGISAARVDLTAQLWLPSFLAWFAAGMMLAVLEPAARERGFPRRPWLLTTPCLLTAAAAFALACTPLAGADTIMPSGTGQSVLKNVLYTVCTLGVLAPLALARSRPGRAPGWYIRALAWRPVVWLGEISYEFYLIHLLVMDLMMDALGYADFHGSIVTLVEVTIVLTLPPAWLLARLTQPRVVRRGTVYDAQAPDRIVDPAAAGPGPAAAPHAAQPRQRPVAENSSSNAVAADKSSP